MTGNTKNSKIIYPLLTLSVVTLSLLWSSLDFVILWLNFFSIQLHFKKATFDIKSSSPVFWCFIVAFYGMEDGQNQYMLTNKKIITSFFILSY